MSGSAMSVQRQMSNLGRFFLTVKVTPAMAASRPIPNPSSLPACPSYFFSVFAKSSIR